MRLWDKNLIFIRSGCHFQFSLRWGQCLDSQLITFCRVICSCTHPVVGISQHWLVLRPSRGIFCQQELPVLCPLFITGLNMQEDLARCYLLPPARNKHWFNLGRSREVRSLLDWGSSAQAVCEHSWVELFCHPWADSCAVRKRSCSLSPSRTSMSPSRTSTPCGTTLVTPHKNSSILSCFPPVHHDCKRCWLVAFSSLFMHPHKPLSLHLHPSLYFLKIFQFPINCCSFSVSFQVCISPFSVCFATRFWIQKKKNCVFFLPYVSKTLKIAKLLKSLGCVCDKHNKWQRGTSQSRLTSHFKHSEAVNSHSTFQQTQKNKKEPSGPGYSPSKLLVLKWVQMIAV